MLCFSLIFFLIVDHIKSMLHEATRKRWAEQIAADYPRLHPDMINTILDLYSNDKEWLDEKTKELKKAHGKGPVEIKTNLTIEEMELLQEIGEKKRKEAEESFQFGVISEPSP